MTQPLVVIEGQQVDMTMSIGVAVATGVGPVMLIAAADTAMWPRAGPVSAWRMANGTDPAVGPSRRPSPGPTARAPAGCRAVHQRERAAALLDAPGRRWPGDDGSWICSAPLEDVVDLGVAVPALDRVLPDVANHRGSGWPAR